MRANPDTRHVHRLLHDLPTEAGGLVDAGGHVLDADKERDQVGVPLERADRGVERVRHSGVDERVARVGALGGVGPAEQLAEERARGVRVTGADLGVDDG